MGHRLFRPVRLSHVYIYIPLHAAFDCRDRYMYTMVISECKRQGKSGVKALRLSSCAAHRHRRPAASPVVYPCCIPRCIPSLCIPVVSLPHPFVLHPLPHPFVASPVVFPVFITVGMCFWTQICSNQSPATCTLLTACSALVSVRS